MELTVGGFKRHGDIAWLNGYRILWEPSLLAMNDNAVCLANRVANIAGKPSAHRT